jgi:hypothetical protein
MVFVHVNRNSCLPVWWPKRSMAGPAFGRPLSIAPSSDTRSLADLPGAPIEQHREADEARERVALAERVHHGRRISAAGRLTSCGQVVSDISRAMTFTDNR